jgi:uncharacterized phage protein (TIGR02218 family)
MTDAFSAIEQANQILPAYAYILTYQDSDTRIFLTGWESNVVINALPARFNAANPQTFTRAQIAHGEHGLSAEFENRPLTLSVTTQSQELTRYFATASATKITVHIFRINSGKLKTSEALDWEIDTILLNTGKIKSISFSGQQINCELEAEPFGANQGIPRYYFSRGCNHVLGHAKTCKVNMAAFTHSALIAELDAAQRLITLSITPPGAVADYFRSGVMHHTDSGQRVAIEWSDAGGTAGKTRIKLRFWNPAFQAGSAVSVSAGCRHTTEDCAGKFANLGNYGGFPFVPNRNPAMHGVGA